MPQAFDRDPRELGSLIEAGLYRPSPEQVAEAMLARAELVRLLGASRDRLRPAGRIPISEASALRAP
jgi:hypothetical protein